MIGFLGRRSPPRWPRGPRFPARLRELGLDRGPYRRDRVSLGRGASIACRDCSRIGSTRSDVIVTTGSRGIAPSRRHDHPDRLRGWRATRSATASSRAWRDRAATSPAIVSSSLCGQATGTAARSSPRASAARRSLATSASRAVLEMRRPGSARRSASNSSLSNPTGRDIEPVSKHSSKGDADALLVGGGPFMNTNRVRINTLAARCAAADDYPHTGEGRSGGLMSYGPAFR